MMLQPQDTVYPVLTKRLTDKTLTLNFSPTAADLAFVQQQAKRHRTRGLLLVMLKVTQYLHRVPLPETIPYTVIKFITGCLDHSPSLQKRQIKEYQSSGTFKRHASLIRQYLQLDSHDQRRETYCIEQGIQQAQVKEHLADIINALVEALIRQQFELPAFSRLEKIARHCRVQANDQLHTRLYQALSQQQHRLLQQLFAATAIDEHTSDWQRLKQEPDKPTASHIRDFLSHFQWLKTLANSLPSIDELPVGKRTQFRDEAMALHSNDIRELRKEKRLALAIVLVQTQWAQALDDLTDMLIKTLNEIEQEGRQAFQSTYLDSRQRADKLITHFRDCLQAYQASSGISDPTERIEHTFASLAGDTGTLLDQCNAHLAQVAHDDRPCVLKVYRRKRRLLFQILEHLPLAATTESQRLIVMGQTLQALYAQHDTEYIEFDVTEADLALLPVAWHPMIIPQERTAGALTINRFCLEIAWLLTMKSQLKTFHCFVPAAQKYGDPDTQMISWDEYHQLLPAYRELSGLPTEGKALVKQLKAELSASAKDIDQRFPDLKGVHLRNDQLVLQRAYTHYRSPTLDSLHRALQRHMPKASIIDVISDTVRWLELDRLFKPHSGLEGKLENPLLRLVATLFCYGCNVGAQQTADSIKGLSRKQVAWLNARYANLRSLEKAIKKSVDTYAGMALPKQWGDGSHAAADGTHRPVYDANLLSEFHVRYRERGAIGYYVVSDQYIALFSHFIACGAHESWYILDGVVQNDLEIKPTILHGDILETYKPNVSNFSLTGYI